MAHLIVSLTAVSDRGAAQAFNPPLYFEIQQGQHWAFTGTNEWLKTALLEALAGRTTMLNAVVQYLFSAPDGTPLSTQASQKKVQLVSGRHLFRTLSNTTDFYYQQRFNSADAENSLTVADHLHALQEPTPNPVWTFEKVVGALNLHALLPERLIKLSNGETKRVLLAAALLRNPALLLLHNPIAGLDVAARQEITGVLDTVAQSGTTLVLITAPTELPEAITHVAHFTEANTIVTVARHDFKPDAVAAPAINTSELAALLAANPLPVFQTIVQLKNVSIRYGDKLILDAINWTVKQGSRWALTGPNGSGKSTLLSLITGDNPQAFANDIILFDRLKGSGESIWDIKKKIGAFSPELYQYFPVETSCLQAVESGFWDTIGLFRPSHAHFAALALRWMKLLHIDGLAQKPLRAVAPVQQRLVLLARALVKSPVLLVLDEPCQGFNATEQAYFKTLIDAVCTLRNLTLIYVSHYRNELPDSIENELRLHEGKQV